MIARYWRGGARQHTASAYLDHLRTETLPRLRALDGHRGAFVLQRETADEIEFVVRTLWDSLEPVPAFAGEDYEAAVVPPRRAACSRASTSAWCTTSSRSVPRPGGANDE